MPRAVITYHDVEQGTPQWLIDREGKYTGSNAHKLLGNLGVLEYARAEVSGFGGNFHTKRGHLLEDKAVYTYERIYGVEVGHTGYITNSLYPNCLYSPDGFTEKILQEVKCFSNEKHLKIYNAKSWLDIDIKITAQIHYGMLITGRRLAHLIIYNPNFAKKQLENEEGEMVDNPLYDPKKAFKVIVIRYDKDIANNFKRKLGGAHVQPAVS